jgi:hypothetical protein
VGVCIGLVHEGQALIMRIMRLFLFSLEVSGTSGSGDQRSDEPVQNMSL